MGCEWPKVELVGRQSQREVVRATVVLGWGGRKKPGDVDVLSLQHKILLKATEWGKTSIPPREYSSTSPQVDNSLHWRRNSRNCGEFSSVLLKNKSVNFESWSLYYYWYTFCNRTEPGVCKVLFCRGISSSYHKLHNNIHNLVDCNSAITLCCHTSL